MGNAANKQKAGIQKIGYRSVLALRNVKKRYTLIIERIKYMQRLSRFQIAHPKPVPQRIMKGQVKWLFTSTKK
ncbi:MAG: hypothetical protein BroJett041_03330 [Candidatus Jettenia caeni]|nr:MAG: hypothetical protein BroJett041_03330 [Candidatus Jettenia caeni]GJQ45768.1 MAG: hypothetical protein JETCAE04_15220 [Candidatus Jettenia caeni]